jgi:hypothetical protein
MLSLVFIASILFSIAAGQEADNEDLVEPLHIKNNPFTDFIMHVVDSLEVLDTRLGFIENRGYDQRLPWNEEIFDKVFYRTADKSKETVVQLIEQTRITAPFQLVIHTYSLLVEERYLDDGIANGWVFYALSNGVPFKCVVTNVDKESNRLKCCNDGRYLHDLKFRHVSYASVAEGKWYDDSSVNVCNFTWVNGMLANVSEFEMGVDVAVSLFVLCVKLMVAVVATVIVAVLFENWRLK